jgi:uncharacterized protein with ATP-grasp and redox domains
VIAKGQGNYESLDEMALEKLFLILIVKCDLVSDKLGVKKLDIIVKQNKKNEI